MGNCHVERRLKADIGVGLKEEFHPKVELPFICLLPHFGATFGTF